MTQEQNTEPAAGAEGGEESAVIKALRSQINDLSKELKSRPSEDDIIAKYEAARAKEDAIKGVLTARGVPSGVAELVQNKLGENEPTEEKVVEVLTGIGFNVAEDGAGSGQEGSSQEGAAELAGVADLSSKVGAAAGSQGPASMIDRINQAKSSQEIAEIAAEGGFLAG